MQIVRLRSPRGQQDKTFTDINDDRRDTETSLDFMTVVCECGAEGLYLMETAHEIRPSKWKPDTAMSGGSLWNLDLECPANCGATQRLALSNVHPYHGVKLRLLESWRHDVTVGGLLSEEDKKSTTKRSEPTQDTVLYGGRTRGRNDYIQIYKDQAGDLVFRLEIAMRPHEVVGCDARNEIKARVNSLLHNYPRSWLP